MKPPLPATPDDANVVVLVAQLPSGDRVQIELILRVSRVPTPPPRSLPVVVA